MERTLSLAEMVELGRTVPHQQHRYRKGEVVFHMGEPATRLGLVLAGSLQAQKIFADGSEVSVSRRQTGDLAGHGAVFSPAGVYPCDVVALEPTEVMLFTRDDWLTLLQTHEAMLTAFITSMAAVTADLQTKIELLLYPGIAQKAVFWLLNEWHKAPDARKVTLPETITQWSHMLHVSRPSLYRELKKLEDAGFIKRHGRTVYLLNISELEKILRQ